MKATLLSVGNYTIGKTYRNYATPADAFLAPREQLLRSSATAQRRRGEARAVEEARRGRQRAESDSRTTIARLTRHGAEDGIHTKEEGPKENRKEGRPPKGKTKRTKRKEQERS